MRYAIVENGVVTNAVVADEPLGANWIEAEYAGPGWVYSGGSFSPPPVPPVPVPERVTARQARLALNAAGLLDDVDAAIAASSREVQLTWEYATEIERSHPILAQVATGLGMTSNQMDDLFRQAATL